MGQIPNTRRDGWTPERQLTFLRTLAETRSITRAASSAGMSRESAYRLRRRNEGMLFAALWDRAIQGTSSSLPKSHEVNSRRRRSQRKIRANPPKVTKWTKWTDPGFQPLLDQLRDLGLSAE